MRFLIEFVFYIICSRNDSIPELRRECHLVLYYLISEYYRKNDTQNKDKEDDNQDHCPDKCCLYKRFLKLFLALLCDLQFLIFNILRFCIDYEKRTAALTMKSVKGVNS